MTQRTSFAKLQRDRDRQAKAAAKRDRRQERQTEAAEAVDTGQMLDDAGAEISVSELLALVAAVHRQFEEEAIDFETFEQTKAELLARLPVD